MRVPHVPQISPVLGRHHKSLQPESANQWRLGRRKSLRGSDKHPVLDVFTVVFAPSDQQLRVRHASEVS